MELRLGTNVQHNAVINYLLSEDKYVSDAIAKCPDKDFTGCWNYIVGNAKKLAVNNCAVVKDENVYQWAKDYFIDYEVRKVAEETRKADELKNNLKKSMKINLSTILGKWEKAILKGFKAPHDKQYYIDLENQITTGLLKPEAITEELNKEIADTVSKINESLVVKEEPKPAEVKPNLKAEAKETKKEEPKKTEQLSFDLFD